MSSAHHHTLPHGLTLVIHEQPHLKSASVALAVGVGGRHDSAKKWGLTHFLEHMMFRGSAAYPDAAALIAPFERGGGTLQAETWRDHTLFSSTVHPRHLGEVLAALGNMMTHPRFNDIEAERALVEAEISGELDASGDDADLGALSRARIWAGHPLGRRIVGSLASSPTWTATDVRRHHRRHYVGHNMVLAVAGCVSAAEVKTAVAAAFADLRPGVRTLSGRPPQFRGRPLVTIPRDDHEVTVQLTFEALPDGHPDFAALSLLTSLLDDGMGTRLHRALSEKSGLVYTFSTGLDCYADCGLYDIELQVPAARVQAALAAACEVLYDVAHGAVGELELRAMQERTLCAIELGQDSAEDVAQEAAVDALFGRPGPKAYEAALRRTTPDAIQRIAHQMFMASRYQVTVLTPAAGIELDHLASVIPAMRQRVHGAAPLFSGRRSGSRRKVATTRMRDSR